MEAAAEICTVAALGVVELRANLARSAVVGKEKRPPDNKPEGRRSDTIRLGKEQGYPVV